MCRSFGTKLDVSRLARVESGIGSAAESTMVSMHVWSAAVAGTFHANCATSGSSGLTSGSVVQPTKFQPVLESMAPHAVLFGGNVVVQKLLGSGGVSSVASAKNVATRTSVAVDRPRFDTWTY